MEIPKEPVIFFKSLGNHNVIVWSDDRRSRFEKYGRFFWNFHFALAGVITEVEAYTDDFADLANGGPSRAEAGTWEAGVRLLVG